MIAKMPSAPEVLLVEDSDSDTRMILKALSQSPRRKHVTTLADGDSALGYLQDPRHAKPDLILLDLNLPKKDGWDVLKACKSDPALKAIPIVVLSTTRQEDDIQRCYALGANCVVAKPFELNPFLEAVHGIEDYWLGLAELRAAN
jgi:CheY-like chemotaxis protein